MILHISNYLESKILKPPTSSIPECTSKFMMWVLFFTCYFKNFVEFLHAHALNSSKSQKIMRVHMHFTYFYLLFRALACVIFACVCVCACSACRLKSWTYVWFVWNLIVIKVNNSKILKRLYRNFNEEFFKSIYLKKSVLIYSIGDS